MNEKLLKAIETFAASRQAKSKNVYLLNDIDSKLLELHKNVMLRSVVMKNRCWQ